MQRVSGHLVHGLARAMACFLIFFLGGVLVAWPAMQVGVWIGLLVAFVASPLGDRLGAEGVQYFAVVFGSMFIFLVVAGIAGPLALASVVSTDTDLRIATLLGALVSVGIALVVVWRQATGRGGRSTRRRTPPARTS